MSIKNLLSKIKGKYNRTLVNNFCQRLVKLNTSTPVISFTFDDAPKSAYDMGGAILNSYGAKATYFVSLGLLGTETEVGTIANSDDLVSAIEHGHELGCHTFDHVDAWETPRDQYMQSVEKNGQALKKIIPGGKFRTFAYPKNGALLSVKSPLQERFICCRGGGQLPNVGTMDLNLLKSCFLDRRTKIDMQTVKKLIDYNKSQRGWLIFSTHDISDKPSIYGCTPEFFQEVVAYSVHSGAMILPVADACEKLLQASST